LTTKNLNVPPAGDFKCALQDRSPQLRRPSPLFLGDEKTAPGVEPTHSERQFGPARTIVLSGTRLLKSS